MPALTLTRYVASASGLAGAMITDMQIRDEGGGAGPTLYVTTGYSGYISAWDLTTAGPQQTNASRHTRNDVPGTTACIGFVQTSLGLAVLTGGGSDGPLVLRDVKGDGGLGAQTNLGILPALPGDLIATVTVTLADGTQMVYGGLAGASGVGHLVFSATGSLTGSGVTADTAATAAGQVVALAAAPIGGQQYLFTASSQDVGVTMWAVSSAGALAPVNTLTGGNGGLWIGTPTAMATAVVAGQTYLVLTSAGSSTINLIAVGPGSTMIVTDSVMDDLNSRFAGATAMTVVEHGGQTYVVAGGGDDGISLFQILPGGRLLALAHLADTAAMGLSDVSAIAAQSTSTGIEIFVGSSSETGITQLRYDPGPAGQTLIALSSGSGLTGSGANDVLAGGAGNDWLSGGGGDDILIDGAGQDGMSGGTGADIFVLAADGTPDTITDFTPGSDRIDLSGWHLLHGTDQLSMASTPTGMTISYGDEYLMILSSSGGPINPATVTETDLLNLTRLAVAIPYIPAPPRSGVGGIGNDLLFGESGDDTLNGNLGYDRIYGGDGSDYLVGSFGGDRLDGGTGPDWLVGGPDNDIYVIDDVGDWVQEDLPSAMRGGIDVVEAWVSHTLTANTEVLILQGTQDLTGTGQATARDAVIGNSGGNLLDGLGGNDGINGWSGNDTLIGGEGRDWLSGGEGADVFVYRSTADSGLGRGQRDLIDGFEQGQDVIHLYNVDANTLVSGNQTFTFIGTDGFGGQGAASAGELRTQTFANGRFVLLEMDANGDGWVDMQIMVWGATTLSADDLVL